MNPFDRDDFYNAVVNRCVLPVLVTAFSADDSPALAA